MNEVKLTKSDKILIALYHLNKGNKGKRITREDVAVEVWKKYPKDFCMQGYEEYPNPEINKYITNPLRKGLIFGSATSYKITNKGIDYVLSLIKRNKGKIKETENVMNSKAVSREIEKEIDRIKSTKIYNHFIKEKTIDLLESDLFEFLGTSARTFKKDRKYVFTNRYDIIVNIVIPFCASNKKNNKEIKKILKLWELLSNKFHHVFEEVRNV